MKKEKYVAPECDVIEVQAQSVLAMSDPDYESSGEFNFDEE